MRKNLLSYTIAFSLLLVILLFFNSAYRALTNYAEQMNGQNKVHSTFENLSRQINNTAVMTPQLFNLNSNIVNELFFSDSENIIHQLIQVKSATGDSMSSDIIDELDSITRNELSWLINSSIVDSIITQKSPAHIAAFRKITSLINQGIERTSVLSELSRKKLNNAIRKVRLSMMAFIIISGLLLMYTTTNLFKQQLIRRKKEKELETTLNRIRDGVISLDNNWNYTFLNDAALSAHPLGREKTLGHPIWEIHPQLRETVFGNMYEESKRTKKVMEEESYYAPMDKWFSAKAYPSGDGLTIYFRDVTESKKAEQLLLKSEKIYKTIASSIPGSVITLLDKDYNYLLVEGDMVEKMGYKKNELLGNNLKNVVPKELYDETSKILERVFKGETIIRELRRNNYDIVSRYIPLKDEHTEVYAVMTMAIDITQLKNAQRDIADLNRSLEEKITFRTEQLRKTNEELEAFTYSVSHDLRAPLRAIIGFTAILEEDYSSKLDQEAKRITSIIQANTLKMGHLIDDLLAFSRLSRQDIAKTDVVTNDLVKEVITTIMSQNADGRIKWDVQSLPDVKADINALRQVWVNLISNAVKYSQNSERPHIQIGYSQTKEKTTFFVKDNGVGFDEKYKHKLFKVFQRLHSEEQFEGTGVGLAIVERIIAKHGGSVWAEAKENEGATFWFSLPRQAP